MREILFRGKRADNGEWVEGDFFHPNRILQRYGNGFFNNIEVTQETVGQYTGLTDKNGKRIFEEDILQIWHKNPYTNQERKDNLGIVIFEDGLFGYQEIDDRYRFVYKIEESDIKFDPNESDYKTFEIIGNIHDNPELLEEKQ